MKTRSILFLIFICLVSFVSFGFATADEDVASQNQPAKNAEPPEVIYKKYALAVHKGDVNTITQLVYSKSAFLWKKSTQQMMAMAKNTVPENPSLISKRSEKEYQYNYMILDMTGVSPKGGSKKGSIKMIVENGQWKVYQETWK